MRRFSAASPCDSLLGLRVGRVYYAWDSWGEVTAVRQFHFIESYSEDNCQCRAIKLPLRNAVISNGLPWQPPPQPRFSHSKRTLIGPSTTPATIPTTTVIFQHPGSLFTYEQ